MAGVWAEGVARFKAGRLWVARNRPYYARALFACPVAFTDRVGTIAVNGLWRLKANPVFCARLTASQVGAVLVHEMNHVLRDHHGRSLRAGIPDEGFSLWSLAADFEVNDDLRDDGLDMPDGIIYPDEFGLEPGRLAEQYYRDMIDMAEAADDSDHHECGYRLGGPDDGEGDGNGGGRDGPGPARREQLRRQTAQDVLAHREAEGDWSVPAGLASWAVRQIEPQVDWRRLLASELRKGIHRRPGTGDATWSRPPRRPDDGPVLRPGTAKPSADVAVVVDTSSSMQPRRPQPGRRRGQRHPADRGARRGDHRLQRRPARHSTAQTVTQTRQIALVGGGGTDMGRAIMRRRRVSPAPARGDHRHHRRGTPPGRPTGPPAWPPR